MFCSRRSFTFASVVLTLLLSPYVVEAQGPNAGEHLLDPVQVVTSPPWEMLGSDSGAQTSSSGTGTSPSVVEAPLVCAGDDALPNDLAGRALRRLACADGFYVDSDCPEGELCVTWCSLKATITFCSVVNGERHCQTWCYYGDCGLS